MHVRTMLTFQNLQLLSCSLTANTYLRPRNLIYLWVRLVKNFAFDGHWLPYRKFPLVNVVLAMLSRLFERQSVSPSHFLQCFKFALTATLNVVAVLCIQSATSCSNVNVQPYEDLKNLFFFSFEEWCQTQVDLYFLAHKFMHFYNTSRHLSVLVQARLLGLTFSAYIRVVSSPDRFNIAFSSAYPWLKAKVIGRNFPVGLPVWLHN